MKESHSERLAIHTGLESCGVVRESNVEALTGEGAGRVFSRETYAGLWMNRQPPASQRYFIRKN